MTNFHGATHKKHAGSRNTRYSVKNSEKYVSELVSQYASAPLENMQAIYNHMKMKGKVPLPTEFSKNRNLANNQYYHNKACEVQGSYPGFRNWMPEMAIVKFSSILFFMEDHVIYSDHNHVFFFKIESCIRTSMDIKISCFRYP